MQLMQAKPQKLSLKSRALRYLTQREHSRLELARKLARYAEAQDDIEAVLDWLEKNDFLSCERFSESLVRRRAENYGNRRVLAELQTHALDPELLAQYKDELDKSEVERAKAVWQKKFGRVGISLSAKDAESEPESSMDAKTKYAARMKQVQYLAQRGFSSQAIRAAMADKLDDLEES